MKTITWIKTSEKLPEFGGEYLVVWDLQDNERPLTTCMDFDWEEKKFLDMMGAGTKHDETTILYWAEMPSPPKRISKK